MNIPRGPLDILLYCCIVLGSVGYIGFLATAAELLPFTFPYGKYRAQYLGIIGDASISAVIITIIFGIATIVLWFFAKPSSTMSIAYILRILIGVCIIVELCTNISCCAVSDYSYISEHIMPVFKDPPDQYYEWLEKHWSYTKRISNENKILHCCSKFYTFLIINFVYATLSAVYWAGFYLNWFSNSGPSSNQPTQEEPQPYQQNAQNNEFYTGSEPI